MQPQSRPAPSVLLLGVVGLARHWDLGKTQWLLRNLRLGLVLLPGLLLALVHPPEALPPRQPVLSPSKVRLQTNPRLLRRSALRQGSASLRGLEEVHLGLKSLPRLEAVVFLGRQQQGLGQALLSQRRVAQPAGRLTVFSHRRAR